MILKVASTLLYFVGVQPKNQNNFANAKLALTCFMLMAMSILSVMEVVVNWKSIETLGKAEIVPVYLKNALTLIIYSFSKNRWKSVLEDMNNKFWNFDALDVELYLKQTSVLLTTTRFVKFYVSTIITVIIIYFFKPAFTRDLPYFIYLFCDTTYLTCYVGIYLLEVLSNALHAVAVVGLDILFIYQISRAYCEFEAIEYYLAKIDGHGRTDVVEKEIIVLLEHHAFVLGTVENLRKIWTYIFFFQYWASTLSICFGIFLMNIHGIPPSLDDFMRYSSFLSAFIVQLSIYCFAGTVLMQQSTSVSKAAFEVNWWVKTQPNVRKYLAMMIQRANKPGVLDIAGVTPMCLEVFPQILKTAFSFFTLMKNLHED